MTGSGLVGPAHYLLQQAWLSVVVRSLRVAACGGFQGGPGGPWAGVGGEGSSFPLAALAPVVAQGVGEDMRGKSRAVDFRAEALVGFSTAGGAPSGR